MKNMFPMILMSDVGGTDKTLDVVNCTLRENTTDPASLMAFGAIGIVLQTQQNKVDFTITGKSEGEYDDAGTWSFGDDRTGTTADGAIYYDAYHHETNSFKIKISSQLNMEGTFSNRNRTERLLRQWCRSAIDPFEDFFEKIENF